MAGQKILIVDDSITIRMQVREMLAKGSFEVSEAKDGIEGLERIRQERPSLVLLDFFMPRMNGWEVLQQIQSQVDLQVIPIVVMTGRKSEAEARVPELFKYFEFIEKPFEPKTLLGAVKSAMLKARSRQSVAVSLPESDPRANQGTAIVANGAAATIAPPPPVSSNSEQSELVAALNALRGQIEQLTQQNTNLQIELQVAKNQASQSTMAEVTTLRTDLDLLNQRNQTLEAQILLLKEQNSRGIFAGEEGLALKATLDMIKRELEALKDRPGSGGIGDADAVYDELLALKTALQSANQRSSRMQDEIDGLTRQNAKMQAEIDHLKKQMGQVSIVIQKKFS